MKIAISSIGNNLDSQVAPRFGRCHYFLIVDIDTMSFEAISNESVKTFGGAGIQAAQVIAKAGVKTVMTGNLGQNAYQTLKAAGIKVITEVSGTIKDALELYKKDKLQKTAEHNMYGDFRTSREMFGKGGDI